MIFKTIGYIVIILYVLVIAVLLSKFRVRTKVRTYTTIIWIIANTLWLIWCLEGRYYPYVFILVLYIFLEIFLIFNLIKFIKKQKRKKHKRRIEKQ